MFPLSYQDSSNVSKQHKKLCIKVGGTRGLSSKWLSTITVGVLGCFSSVLSSFSIGWQGVALDDRGCEDGLQLKCPGSVVSSFFVSSLLREMVLSDEGLKGSKKWKQILME